MATSFTLAFVLMIVIGKDWMIFVQSYPNSFVGQAGDVSTLETGKDDLMKPHLKIIPGTDKTLL